jgi:hypothetical protein
MNPAIPLPEASPGRRRGRWQLLLLLAVAVGPMLLASSMYHWRFWVPDGRNYHGELIGNGQGRADLGVIADENRWQLLVTAPQGCAESCQSLVYLARQIHIGLGREASRASHALASGMALDADYIERLEREYPQLQRYPLDMPAYRGVAGEAEDARLWIVDPHGNLVLRYDAKANGKHILNDLRHLLKLSKIG